MRDIKTGIKDLFLSKIKDQLGNIQDENEKKETAEKAEKYLKNYEYEFEKELNRIANHLLDDIVYKLKSDTGQDFNISSDKFDDIFRKELLEQIYKMNK